MRSYRNVLKNPIVWLVIVAAILYSSWPLGYLLNPDVARGAFASQLEAPHQPYNWLFIGLDVASGVVLLAAGLIQWFRTSNRVVKLSVASYMAFAALVIVAALVPYDCSTATESCYSAAHSPLLLIHGLASILSPLSLLVSLILVLKVLFDQQSLRWVNTVTLSIIGCWVVTGILALLNYHHASENIVQYMFISLCGVSVICSATISESLTRAQSVE